MDMEPVATGVSSSAVSGEASAPTIRRNRAREMMNFARKLVDAEKALLDYHTSTTMLINECPFEDELDKRHVRFGSNLIREVTRVDMNGSVFLGAPRTMTYP
jgi:hypothetical protein